MADHVVGVTDMVLTPEMRAEMREKAQRIRGPARVLVLTLLDYCDRLERERDEAHEINRDYLNTPVGQYIARAETAGTALSAAHERMREMAEALEHIEQNDPFWANNGPLPRVLADYRKGNADA